MLDRSPLPDPDTVLLDAYSQTVSEVAEAVGPAVSAVKIGSGGQGSGVVLSPDGLVVTNAHVVKDHAEVNLAFPDARRASGRVLGKDADTDLALVKADIAGLPSARLGDSGYLRR